MTRPSTGPGARRPRIVRSSSLWLLVMALLLGNQALLQRQMMGLLHRHAAPQAEASLLTDGPAVRLLRTALAPLRPLGDALHAHSQAWGQRHGLMTRQAPGHRAEATVAAGPSRTHAHAHQHRSWQRHHHPVNHPIGQPSLQALDGAAAGQDGGGASTAGDVSWPWQATVAMAVPTPEAGRHACPTAPSAGWQNAAQARLERPPRA